MGLHISLSANIWADKEGWRRILEAIVNAIIGRATVAESWYLRYRLPDELSLERSIEQINGNTL